MAEAIEQEYNDLDAVLLQEKSALKGAHKASSESARLEFAAARRAGDLTRMSELQDEKDSGFREADRAGSGNDGG